MSADKTIIVNVSSTGAAVNKRSFGIPLFVSEDNTFSGGDVVRAYASNAEAQADSELGADGKAAAAIAFQQDDAKLVPLIKVCEVDLSAETVSQQLANIEAADPDFYGVCLASRAKAKILELATYAETEKKLASAQSSDADFLAGTAGNVADTIKGLSQLRTIVSYHADDSEFLDWGWLCAKLAADPDSRVTNWYDCTIAGVTPGALSTTAEGLIEADGGNHYTTLGGVGATYPGKTAGGRWIEEVVTDDWLEARIKERIAALRLKVSNNNQRINYDQVGLERYGTEIRTAMLVGEGPGDPVHFVEGSTKVIVPTYGKTGATAADKGLRQATFTVKGAYGGSLQKFTINVQLENI